MIDTPARVTALYSATVRQFPEDAGLLEAIAELRALVDGLPERFSFEADELLVARTAAASPHLAADVGAWLGFLCHSLGYKLDRLVSHVLMGLDTADPVLALNAARALVEHSAVLNDVHAELALTKDLLATRDILYRFADATRLNTEAILRGDHDAYLADPEGVTDERKAKHVMKLLDRLPQAEAKKVARMHYAQLCEFVHPNGLSHRLMLDELVRLSDGRARYTLAKRPASEAMAIGVVHLLAIPVRHSLLTSSLQLGELLERQRSW